MYKQIDEYKLSKAATHRCKIWLDVAHNNMVGSYFSTMKLDP